MAAAAAPYHTSPQYRPKPQAGNVIMTTPQAPLARILYTSMLVSHTSSMLDEHTTANPKTKKGGSGIVQATHAQWQQLT
jgi:hypothetical protein